MLAHIANEYIYEYFPRDKRLVLSNKFGPFFKNKEILDIITRALKDALSDNDFSSPNNTMIISLSLPHGQTRTFKAVNSNIPGHRGKPGFVIGKLIDVSEDAAEKKELLLKSQKDGMTDLYNAATTKDLITEFVENKKDDTLDALILIDCDKFKSVNDKYGHFKGNQVLELIAASLKKVFRSTDILGRIGGDEFCIFIKNVPSVDFVREKCLRLIKQINSKVENAGEEIQVSVSIGVAMIRRRESYESVFKRADAALYKAKRNRKSRIVIYGRK
jgi:diguanylate cyclase (GGDEF)-like protein